MKQLVKLLCFLIIVCSTQTVFAEGEDVGYYVVELANNEGCLVDENFDGKNNINGCKGIDAAYINEDDYYVYYMYSGAIGHAVKDRVNIHNADDYLDKISSFTNINGILYHNIKTDIDSKYYAYSLAIDDAPEYIKEGTKYYSYDSHYFYDNYYKMIDDYRNDTRENAVNSVPYYNYYQYLSFRSTSNYTFEEINDYFINKLHINAPLDKYFDYNDDGANDYVNKSQYHNELESFFVSEETYGINSMILLSISMYESNYGKSLESFTANNLFQNAAFSTPEETENQRYNKLENSVYSFAKYYMADRYCNPIRNAYSGSFLGNKESGMNKTYSNDPYWSEKVAANYYALDSALGYKDKNSMTIGIVDNPSIYRGPNLESLVYKKTGSDYSYVIIGEEENAYKIQLDKNYLETYVYDYKNNVAYISKEDVVLTGSTSISEKEYDSYRLSFDEGYVDGKQELTFSSNKGLLFPTANKDGYEFVDYKDSKATYKEITEIELLSGFEGTIELDSYPDLSNARLLVRYRDGTYKYVNVTSEMLKGFKTDNSGLSGFVIDYNGVTTSASINVSQWPKLVRDDVKSSIDIAINNSDGITEENLRYIKDNIQGIDLDFDEIRAIDKVCLKASNYYPVYYIEDNNLDLSLSGLGLSLSNYKKKGKYQFYDDTFYIKVNNVNGMNLDYLEKFSSDYGFKTVGSMNLSFRYNLLRTNIKSPIIVQTKIDSKESDKYYSVYYLDSNNNVIKCKTQQTNDYIQFLAYGKGDYILLSRPSANVYDIDNHQENVSYINNGVDSFNIMFQILTFFIMMLYNFVCIVIYFLLENNREKRWNDYRKSLRLAESVREEKQKS